MTTTLTPRLAALLGYIKAYASERGVAPTYREMADHMGYRSVSAAHRMITRLEERGHVKRMPGGQARAINILWSNNPHDAALDALIRVGAPATSLNLTLVAGALSDCLARSA